MVRPQMPALVEQIVGTIHEQVERYGESPNGRRHKLIELAVTNGISEFLDTIENPNATGRRTDDLFRRMGHGEAMDGHPLEAMQNAFRLATQESWEYLRSLAIEHQLSTAALAHLGDALFSHIDHLAEQTRLGHVGATRVRERDPALASAKLLDGLIKGSEAENHDEQSSLADWKVPDEVTVFSIRTSRRAAPLELGDLAPLCLLGSDPSGLVLLTSPAYADEVAALLDGTSGVTRVAVAWPVSVTAIPDAYRWTTRTLRLATQGMIRDGRVINCADHRTQIWLHAEPSLRQQLCQELLPPLLAETPNSREILSETLLVWLETRESAPAIAATLGIHPQTVRYRWKRINELFGERLHDPDFVTTMTMLLKASVPLWKNGDQSDFERFKAGDEG
ncbi:hypothetical protein ASG90_03990 [Nocardioides sp. Soil797]|nr:hypothetical protein ASG90_03990 [Nocardioides sp. Soil797]